MEEKKVPALRFRGFDNAWEQRRLGDIGKARSGIAFPDSEQGGREGIPFFKVSDMNLDGNENEMLMAKNYVTLEQIKAHGWTPIEELPAIFFAKVGAAVMLNRKRLCYRPFLLDNNTMAYSLYSSIWNAGFSKALFETVNLVDLVQVGALPSYNASDVEMIVVIIPCYLEQKKLGQYFSQLDHLISLHQRKLEMLKKVKKSMLEKMFPKNDAKVPELRFSDFTDAWEHCKLGDVFEQTSNLVTLGNGEVKLWSLTVEDGLTPKTERYNREFLVKKDDKFKEVRPGDIVYNPMNMTLGAVGYNGMTRSVAVSGYYTTMIARENYDAYYINTWLKSSQAIKLYKIYATGSLIEKQRVQFPTLSIISASFPRDEEQKQIGSTFEKVDTLISLHQRKLEKLKNIKKSMLEKMFII